MTVSGALQRNVGGAIRAPDVLRLLKPVTWFPPMWAFACGAIASGASLSEHKAEFALGILLTGPLVCAASQAVNDWFDRHVDAINEPNRPIPSGRIPGTWGLRIAIGWTLLSLAVGSLFGLRGFLATLAANALSWAYSAPPFRFKLNGWLGNATVGLSYEGLAWITGAALMMSPAWPDWRIVTLALLFSAGTHGIMTLNDFKSVGGDARMGVRSLPVVLGVDRAARVACSVMIVPQVIVVALLLTWHRPMFALVIVLLMLAQLQLMRRLLQNPIANAIWYSGTGVTLFVFGMMISAFALRTA